MAETDILNPVQGYWAQLGGNPTWNYDYTRKKANNKQEQSVRLGYPISRDIMNAGHAFTWNWINRPLAVVNRVEQFYCSFKDGYFTVIDWDNGERQFVGRFLDTPNTREVDNGLWTIQGLAFQERPRCRMLVYPSDFTDWGHPLNVVDDDLNPRVALMQGTWAIQVSPLAPGGSTTSTPSALEAIDVTPAAGDYAATSYVGFGFQMTLRAGAAMGKVTVYLDGVGIAVALDLSNGTFTSLAAGVELTAITSSFGGTTAGFTLTGPSLPYSAPSGSTLVGFALQFTDVFLDIHRVMIQYVGASTAGGVSITFPQLTYIY
jgi:hypothetical protein